MHGSNDEVIRKMNVIKQVEKDSIAHELGIEINDILVSIDDKPISDIFDYRFKTRNEYIEVLIQKQDGEEWLLEIDKDEDEDLGLDFANPLMDKERSCTNKCVFCFIDQNPKGMRETIYFKDDDSRLSFLDGNFVTLTNMKDDALERIISYRLSPINISVHATDPELRVAMLKNPRAALVMEHIKKFTDAELYTNFQIVLCKAINDNEHLDRSISDLSSFLPYGQGLSVVPIGITKHREGLTHVEAYTASECADIIDQVEVWQKKLLSIHGTRFVFLADEFYIKAGRALPDAESYEAYEHIDNGIGMMRSFIDEFDEAYNSNLSSEPLVSEVSVITSTGSYGYISDLCSRLEASHGIKVNVYSIVNNFYGHNISVTGLLTGGDIISQLTGKALGEKLLIPCNALKNSEDLLLDDVTIGDISASLGVRVVPVSIHGGEFLEAIIGTRESSVVHRKSYSS